MHVVIFKQLHLSHSSAFLGVDYVYFGDWRLQGIFRINFRNPTNQGLVWSDMSKIHMLKVYSNWTQPSCK